MVLTWILVRGVRESARANNWMVLIKIAAILLFVFGAARAVNTANWHPFLPNGFSGVLTGGAIVFFTYIGFDSVSTAAEECNDPQRDMPLGILITLAACAILYAAVALVLTGIAHWDTLNNAAPVANALKMLGIQPPAADGDGRRAAGDDFVAAGVSVRAGAHLVRDVARPAAARTVLARASASTRRRTSAPGSRDSWSAFRAGILDIGTLGDLTNIGTLFAFVVVSAGVIILRRKQPDRPRGFRVPWVPFLPLLSMVCCLVLMLSLPLETWIRFVVWLLIGLAIYFLYSRKRIARLSGIRLIFSPRTSRRPWRLGHKLVASTGRIAQSAA